MSGDEPTAVAIADSGGSDSWAWRQVGVVAALMSVAVPVLWVVGSYFGKAPSELISFLIGDGWCDPAEIRVGQHCFGDATITSELIPQYERMWSPDNVVHGPYPPAAEAIHLAFHETGLQFGGERAGLMLFLAACTAALLIPAVWAARYRTWPQRGLVLLALGPATVPVLVVLDRGQLTGFLVPLVLLFAVCVIRRRYGWAVTALVLASIVKPQMLLLVVVLLAARRFRDAAIAVAAAAAGVAVSFLAWPGNPVTNFKDWLGNLFGYGDYGSLADPYPQNLSAARSLIVLLNPLDLISHDAYQAFARFVETQPSLISLIILAATTVILIICGRHGNGFLVIMTGILLVIIAPSTSFAYYLALLLVPVALVLRWPDSTESAPRFGWTGALDLLTAERPDRRWLATIVIWIFGLILAPIAIPQTAVGIASSAPMADKAGLVLAVMGPVLLILWATLLVLTVRDARRSSRPTAVRQEGVPIHGN